MLDLTNITDDEVRYGLSTAVGSTVSGSPQWRVLASSLLLASHFSFSATRTYPRPDHPDPFKRKPLMFTLVGILVSLRTTLENEQRAMFELMTRFPTEEALKSATVQELANSIRVAGMADRRARRIRSAMDYVENQFNGSLESLGSLSVSEARLRLLRIPGVGPKAADCLLSIGLGKASVAVDINVFRVTSWLFGLPWAESPDYNNAPQVARVKELLDSAVSNSPLFCQVVHTLFLLYGKHVGRKHPQPGRCLLLDYCLSCAQYPPKIQRSLPIF